MKPSDLNTSIGQESCLFEVTAEFSADFSLLRKSRIVFRALAADQIRAEDCAFHVTYLSGERNVLHEQVEFGQVSNLSYVNPNAIASREFDLLTATTISLPLEPVAGADTITVLFRQDTGRSMFIRRDTIRLERADREEVVPPHSLLIKIAPGHEPRYLKSVTTGRHVFTSRACIGLKGLICTMTAMNELGQRTQGSLGLVARLASFGAGAIAIPRARRLERPERFNKEIIIPEGATFITGRILTIASNAECFYDIQALKISRFRHSVGIPVGIALFEQVSLQIHEAALATSRDEFLSLMQGD